MMKILSLIVSFSLIVAPMPVLAQAAPEKIQKDRLQLGQASSAAAKEIIFDTNDGASNKKISINKTTKKITIDTAVDVTGAVGVTGSATATGDATIDGTVTGKTGVKLGSGTNASKQITVDRAGFDPFMKWNETTGKWTYSNDGSVEKNIGSGSGGEGGVNILQNPSFEDGIAVDWTSSGGTFSSQTYANPDPSGNDSVYSRFVATTVGQYFETTVHATPSYLVGGCLAKINYNTTDAANWKLQVYDNSSNLLKEETLTVKSWQNGYASFPCPVVGTSIKLRVISLAAGQIESDKAHLGSENRTFQVAQAKYVGSLAYPPTASCSWSSLTSWGNLTANASCGTPALTGVAQAPSTKIPAIVFPYQGRGVYKIQASGSFLAGSSSAAINYFRFSDGTNVSPTITLRDSHSAGDSGLGLVAGEIINPVSSSGLVTVNLQAFSSVSGGIITASSGNQELVISVYYFPDSSQTALNPEAQDWLIDANIGGANASLGTGDVASYSPIGNPSLDLVLNTGSAAAKIPCASGTSPTSTTCSGVDENIGVSFTNPTVGFYEACFYFSHVASTSGTISSSINIAFQAVETPGNATTITQEGKTRTGIRVQNDQSVSASEVNGNQITTCGTFYFGSVGEKTIRLMYEQDATSTVGYNLALLGRDAAVGQRDLHVIVRPLLSGYNRPYLLDNPVAVYAYNVSGQSLTTSTDTQITNWTVVKEDGGSNFNASTGVFTAPTSDWYTLSAKIAYTTSTGNASYCNFVTTTTGGIDFLRDYAGGTTVLGLFSSASTYLNKGDTAKILCWQNAGSNRTLANSSSNLNFFTILKRGNQ